MHADRRGEYVQLIGIDGGTGCLGFGAMLKILIEEIEAAGACASKLGMRASRPRPSQRGAAWPGRRWSFLAVRSFTVAGLLLIRQQCKSADWTTNAKEILIWDRILRCWKWTGPHEPPVVHRAGMSTLSFFSLKTLYIAVTLAIFILVAYGVAYWVHRAAGIDRPSLVSIWCWAFRGCSLRCWGSPDWRA